jgi:hypothetical protein
MAAVDLLNKAGKRKAERITKALLFYQQYAASANMAVVPTKPQEPLNASKDDNIWQNVDDALTAFGVE